MLHDKRSPVLLSGIVLGVAALLMGCSSSNNNNNKPSAPAAQSSATTTTSGATTPAATSVGAASATRAASPSTAATTAATSAASPQASGRPADAAPDDQQKLTVVSSDPETFDWQVSEFEQDIAVEHFLARGLIYYDKDGNPVPGLAAQLPSKDNQGISADGMTYTFKLKPNQKFSDGSPLTAKDMEYTVKRMLDPKVAGNYAGFFTDIKGGADYNNALGTKDSPKNPTDAQLQQMRDALGVKAVDDNTLQITLTAPSGSFLARMGLQAVYPVKQSVIEKFGDKWTDPANLVGNGPYIIKEYTPKDHLTLVTNPNYTIGTAPIIKTLTIRMIDNPVDAFKAYQNGEVDVTLVPATQAQQILNDASYKNQIFRHPRQETRGLEFNDTVKPFDNPKVRQAFSKAVDRDTLVKVVYQGIGTPAASWLPPGLPGYDKANEDPLKFDPKAAAQLLSDAGYPNGQGFPSDIKMVLSDTATNRAIFDFVQKQLQDNLKVTIQSDIVDAKTRASRYSNKQFTLFWGGWIGDYPNADDWLQDLWTTGGTTNKPGYSNKDFDAAVKTALAESDPAKQAKLWSAAEKIMMQDAALGPLYHGELVDLFKPKVKGMVQSSIDWIWYGSVLFETTYIAKQ